MFLIFSFYAVLSVFAFAAYIEPEFDRKYLVEHNVFISQPDQPLLGLEQEKKALQQRLEFMVFKDEQLKIQKQLRDVLTLQVSANPYDVYLWREFVFSQVESNSSAQERAWSFLVWNKMHQWNAREQINLAGRCIFFVKTEKNREVSLVCADVIARLLNKQKASTIAHMLKISVPELAELAAHYKVTVRPIGNKGERFDWFN